MTSVPIQAILFDFDGVLVDSEPVRFRAGSAALAEIGMTLTWERFTRCWVGRTDEAALRDLLGDRFAAEGRRIALRRDELYAGWLDEVPTFPDSLRLLGRIPDGMRRAVVTGSRRQHVTHILGHLGLIPSFHGIITAEDYVRAKPAPDPFLTAAHRLGFSPAVCLAIEDSPAGVAAALAAGMPVVAVDRGRGTGGLDGAAWTVASLDELTLTPAGDVVLATARRGEGA